MINNLEAYKVFYYVAKCGSVTKAAGELSISQPAVSQAVKQLENTLDVSLFHRAAKGVRLTGEGELLYSYVAKGYEQIELGVKKVHQMQNMELGEVRIGASDMTLQFYLLPYLETFHERYPNIKVMVSNAPTPEEDRQAPVLPEKPEKAESPKEEPSVPAITEPEPTPETEPAFDIEHWISYAKSTAVSLGLTLDSSATDCWDNPITAKPTCIYLERDINSRLNRYAKDGEITAVWIWYECVGTGSYLIYIGYA